MTFIWELVPPLEGPPFTMVYKKVRDLGVEPLLGNSDDLEEIIKLN